MNKFSKFKQIRNFLMKLGLVTKKCREVGPYYYKINGARSRERAPGAVVYALHEILRKQDAAYAEEKFHLLYPSASWGGEWPRTKCSIKIEEEGKMNFWNLLAPLADSMMLKAEEESH